MLKHAKRIKVVNYMPDKNYDYVGVDEMTKGQKDYLHQFDLNNIEEEYSDSSNNQVILRDELLKSIAPYLKADSSEAVSNILDEYFLLKSKYTVGDLVEIEDWNDEHETSLEYELKAWKIVAIFPELRYVASHRDRSMRALREDSLVPSDLPENGTWDETHPYEGEDFDDDAPENDDDDANIPTIQ